MVSLLQHAENFQRALDRLGKGGTSAAADAAGWDLYHSFQTTMNPSFVDFEPDTEALEPIILRTKLAASIVSFLQRFQWADVTVQMLAKPPESVYSPVGIASEILRRLFETAELSSQREVLAELFKQIWLQSDIQNAAISGSKEIVRLLKAASPSQLPNCAMSVRELLLCFLRIFTVTIHLSLSSGGFPEEDEFWKRTMDHPSAITATVDAIAACESGNADSLFESHEATVIMPAIITWVENLCPGNAAGRLYPDWPLLSGMYRLQEYALGELPGEFSTMPERQKYAGNLARFLASAVEGGVMGDTRLARILTAQGILAPLLAISNGRGDFEMVLSNVEILATGWQSVSEVESLLQGSVIENITAQRSMLGVIRQGASLIQVHQVNPAKRASAVKRARREGYIQGLTEADGSDKLTSVSTATTLSFFDSPVNLDQVRVVQQLAKAVCTSIRLTDGMLDSPSTCVPLREVMMSMEVLLRCQHSAGYPHTEARVKDAAMQLIIVSGQNPAVDGGFVWIDIEGVSFTKTLRKIWKVEGGVPDSAWWLLGGLCAWHECLSRRGSAPADLLSKHYCAVSVANLLSALLESSCLRVDEVTEEAFCVSLKHTWYIIMCIQNDVDLVHLLDGMAAQILTWVFERPEVLMGLVGICTPSTPFLHVELCQAWDEMLVLELDPISRLIEFAETVHEPHRTLCLNSARTALARFYTKEDAQENASSTEFNLLPAFDDVDTMKLSRDVDAVMGGIESRATLSPEQLNAGVDGHLLHLPQVGCSNPGCTNLSGVSEALLDVQRCGGCKIAQYCSPACQTHAWPAHKMACRNVVRNSIRQMPE